MLLPGDLVVFVGTKNKPAAEQDRGLLLVKTTAPVTSLDFPLGTLDQISERDFNMDAVLEIVPLIDEEAGTVLKLRPWRYSNRQYVRMHPD
jgi:hypothetical protein